MSTKPGARPAISRPSPKPPAPAPVPPAYTPAPELNNTAARLTDTFKRRRTGLYAVGVAVIVGAGAIIGAQLKERQQVRVKLATRDQSSTDVVLGSGQEEDKALLRRKEDAYVAVPAELVRDADRNMTQDVSGARGMSYNDRQITFLQDRRGVLMKQRFDLERKLERVQEKRRREDEMEGRRTVGVDVEVKR